MYNRYIPDSGHVPVEHSPSHRSQPHKPPRQGQSTGLLAGLLNGQAAGSDRAGQAFTSLLKTLHLEHLDTGDILLGLIVLFLVLEDGDDLDLIITLALTILLNLGER